MRILAAIHVAATAVLLAAALVMLFFHAPIDDAMGPMQKIVYLHLPAAINAFLACFVVFTAGIGYLWQRRLWWDDLAGAAGLVAVAACAVVLLTGMVWAQSEWDTWWTWSPQLTFSLILFVLYVVYVALRHSIGSRSRRALVCALYGIAAFLDVPLVYLSARLIPDIHPGSLTLGPAMRSTLLVWLVAVTMLTAWLVAVLGRHNRMARLRDAARGGTARDRDVDHVAEPPLTA